MNAPGQPGHPNALRCSRCGGALAVADDVERLHCRYCGTGHLLAHDDVAAVAPAGRISARRAHRALLESLSARGIAGANVFERRLIWYPFWHVRAKLVGWQVLGVPRETATMGIGPDGEERPGPPIREVERVEELVARELDVTLPACDTRGSGLLGVSDRLQGVTLRPFVPGRQDEDAIVCSVVVPSASARWRARRLRSGGLAPNGCTVMQQRLSLVRVRQRLVYYPVWKLRYTSMGVHGEADVDAIGGQVLRGDAPRHGRSRAPRWFVASAIAGWVGGLHPALGVLGLGAHLVRSVGAAGSGGPGVDWTRILSAELDPRPVERVFLDDRSDD